MTEAIRNGSVDLLICNASLDDKSIVGLVQDLRNERLGSNPFVEVIMLLPLSTREFIVKAIESGVDDVLAKPFSPRQVVDRVDALSRYRKPFIVTTDYSGPDRLNADRAGRQIPPKITAPNLLEVMAADGLTRKELKKEIAETARVVAEQKVHRHAYQVGYLVDHLAPLLVSLNGLDDAGPVLDRLAQVCSDMVRRLPDTPHGAIDRATRTMAVMATKLKTAPVEAQTKWLREMPTLAAEIRKIAPPLPVKEGVDPAPLSRWAVNVVDVAST